MKVIVWLKIVELGEMVQFLSKLVIFSTVYSIQYDWGSNRSQLRMRFKPLFIDQLNHRIKMNKSNDRIYI